MLCHLKSFLTDRQEILNRQPSNLKNVKEGVPEGLVLGLLIYINDLPLGLDADINLFAYDTSHFHLLMTLISMDLNSIAIL